MKWWLLAMFCVFSNLEDFKAQIERLPRYIEKKWLLLGHPVKYTSVRPDARWRTVCRHVLFATIPLRPHCGISLPPTWCNTCAYLDICSVCVRASLPTRVGEKTFLQELCFVNTPFRHHLHHRRPKWLFCAQIFSTGTSLRLYCKE